MRFCSRIDLTWNDNFWPVAAEKRKTSTSSAFSIRPQIVAGMETGSASSAVLFAFASTATGSTTMTSCPSVLTPRGVVMRKSRTPGAASAATVMRTFIVCKFGSDFLSASFFSGCTISPVTPVPLMMTWSAPYML